MNTFYIFGAGPSYLDVTEEEWSYLNTKETLTFARVPYGSRKFKYYMSIERNYLDESVLNYMAELGYLDTTLLLSIPESIRLAMNLGFKDIQPIVKQTFYFLPSKRPWFVDENEPPHKFKECRAKRFRQPIFRFRGQLTAAINCAIILGASEIRLIGVDLNNQLNFYQTNYLETCCKNKDIIKEYREHDKKNFNDNIKTFDSNFNINTMHTTNIEYNEEGKWGDRKIRGIADVLQWMDSELKEEGLDGIYITNKKSKLFKENKLLYRGIKD